MKKITYKNSGVDLENSEKLSRILLSDLGSENFENFAGTYRFFEHPALEDCLLAASVDGIGTKIIPLIEKKMYKTMAQDLAAMNINDIICVGAKPLFFLDYIAVHTLETGAVSAFVKELHSVLLKYDCMLLGGETSETGDIIKDGLFDAAGFIVGLVKKGDLINKNNVCAGDVVIGLKSTGVHSNGFSFIRKLHKEGCISDIELDKTLVPTAIYADVILKICSNRLASAFSNITGGGILSNVERAIPDGLCAVLNKNSIPKQDVFDILSKFTDEDEMYRIFNMGAGFAIIAEEKNADEIMKIAKPFEPFVFGRIEKGKDEKKAVFKN